MTMRTAKGTSRRASDIMDARARAESIANNNPFRGGSGIPTANRKSSAIPTRRASATGTGTPARKASRVASPRRAAQDVQALERALSRTVSIGDLDGFSMGRARQPTIGEHDGFSMGRTRLAVDDQDAGYVFGFGSSSPAHADEQLNLKRSSDGEGDNDDVDVFGTRRERERDRSPRYVPDAEASSALARELEQEHVLNKKGQPIHVNEEKTSYGYENIKQHQDKLKNGEVQKFDLSHFGGRVICAEWLSLELRPRPLYCSKGLGCRRTHDFPETR